MTTSTDATSVCTSIEVAAPVEHAFDVFADIGTWWDEDKHILAAPLAEMVLEPQVGGHIIDRGVDGSECRWATVLVYDPPRRLCFSWDITTGWQIEHDPSRCSEVEVTFAETAPGRTLVTLTHRHLDRHGPGWESMRDAVSRGWGLERFVAAAERRPAPEAETDRRVLGRVLSTVTDDQMRDRLSAARPYTAMVLRTTPRFSRPAADPIVWEHGRRNMALVDAGLLSIVLPVTDDSGLAGFAVFAATSEETKTIMDADPGVRAGVFAYDIHPVRGFPGSTLP